MYKVFNRSIFFRIIVGYLIGLSLMVGVILFATIRLNKINNTVNTLTGRLAVIRELSGDIVNRTLNMRHFSYRYMDIGKHFEFEKLDKEIEDLHATLDQIDLHIINEEQSKVIEDIRKSANQFNLIFKDISRLIISRQFLLSTEFKTQELIIENEISAIRINVNELKKRKVYLAFGNAQNSFHLMQASHTKYLAEDDEKYFILFKKHYEYFKREFSYLIDFLEGSSISENIIKATATVDLHYQTFIKVREISVKLRKLNRSLGEIETNIIKLASSIDQKVKKEYSTHNILTQDLITFTQYNLFLSIVFAVVLSVGLSVVVSRKIMGPLLEQLRKQVDRQTSDLADQNVKNTQMLKTIESQNKKLQKADKLKDEFLANTSHELRTPLNGIIGLADSLLRGASGPLQKPTIDNLQMIVQSGKRLANLVNDILDFYKMKNQELELQLSSIQLGRLTELVLNISRPLANDRPIRFINNVPADLPLIKGDESRLQQILFNLVGNAIKFTHEGEIKISSEVQDGSVLISVKDTGIGIPLEKQETIFESFEQGDGSTARAYGGTGLGLAITQQLVKLHGGTIEVVSEPQKGSTFSFKLPFFEMQQIEVKPPISELASVRNFTTISEAFQPVTETYPNTKTVLVVDDEPVNLQVLMNYLSLEKYTVYTASNGAEGIELVKKEKPDLLLLDVMMPKMNGYEVCQELRKTYSAAELPIIFLTAKNQIEDLLKGYKSGANDYLAKPFSQEELISRCKTQLDLSSVTAELASMNQSLEKKVADRTRELEQKNEMILEQDRQKKTMLHMLCHDLVNPIGGAETFIQILNETLFENEIGTLPTDLSESEEIMQLSASFLRNALEIINMVRELLAVNEGKIKLEKKLVHLNEMVEMSCQTIKPKFKNKEIIFNNQVDGDITALLDPKFFINSVLSNLLTNAAKFSKKGGEVLINSSQTDKYVILTVQDFGIGMPKSILENIFSTTARTSRSGTDNEMGTGYGMPLVQQIIHISDGKIEITSNEEEAGKTSGTIVTLHLPKESKDRTAIS